MSDDEREAVRSGGPSAAGNRRSFVRAVSGARARLVEVAERSEEVDADATRVVLRAQIGQQVAPRAVHLRREQLVEIGEDEMRVRAHAPIEAVVERERRRLGFAERQRMRAPVDNHDAAARRVPAHVRARVGVHVVRVHVEHAHAEQRVHLDELHQRLRVLPRRPEVGDIRETHAEAGADVGRRCRHQRVGQLDAVGATTRRRADGERQGALRMRQVTQIRRERAVAVRRHLVERCDGGGSRETGATPVREPHTAVDRLSATRVAPHVVPQHPDARIAGARPVVVVRRHDDVGVT